MTLPEDHPLLLAQSQVKKVERETRFAKQLIARAVDAVEADNNDSEEIAHDEQQAQHST